jgi:spore cortex formation protein SpoVR/YcgB (stage V sporulation)
MLSEQYNLGAREPDIQVWNVDSPGDRTLTLRHFAHQRRPLGETVDAVLRHMAWLWGFTVRLETVDADGEVAMAHECTLEKRRGRN